MTYNRLPQQRNLSCTLGCLPVMIMLLIIIVLTLFSARLFAIVF